MAYAHFFFLKFTLVSRIRISGPYKNLIIDLILQLFKINYRKNVFQLVTKIILIY